MEACRDRLVVHVIAAKGRKKKDGECIAHRKLEVGLVRQLLEGTLHGCSPDFVICHLSFVICHSLRVSAIGYWLLAIPEASPGGGMTSPCHQPIISKHLNIGACRLDRMSKR